MISANKCHVTPAGSNGGGPVRFSSGRVSIRSEAFVAEVRGGRSRPPERSRGMTRYLISFDDGAMNHIPDEDWPAVGKASHEVVQEAIDAGVWVFGAGLESQRASVVATDGTVTDGPYPETKEVIGGLSVVDVPSREEALEWAAKTACACRCAVEVREIMPDPETDAMLRQVGSRR
jgi:hypothetical protein